MKRQSYLPLPIIRGLLMAWCQRGACSESLLTRSPKGIAQDAGTRLVLEHPWAEHCEPSWFSGREQQDRLSRRAQAIGSRICYRGAACRLDSGVRQRDIVVSDGIRTLTKRRTSG